MRPRTTTSIKGARQSRVIAGDKRKSNPPAEPSCIWVPSTVHQGKQNDVFCVSSLVDGARHPYANTVRARSE